MAFQDELVQILSQIPAAITKALIDVLVIKHPGHGNQKTHGNRFGTGQAKESLRRLKDDKAAREAYKAVSRGKSRRDLTPEYHQAKTELRRAIESVRHTPKGELGELDKEFISDAQSKVAEELELSQVARSAGFTPGKMTKKEWGQLSDKLKQDANDSLKHAFERDSAGDKLRGQKDTWMQVGGQAVLGRSGRSQREARDLVSQLNRQTKQDASDYMGQSLTKIGYSPKTIKDLDYSQRRRLLAEVGHGQLQHGSISGVTNSERRQVMGKVSATDRMGARSTAMNPRAGKGLEQWTYYEQSALKAGKQPDIIPDYLMDIRELPDYARYPGGRNPYGREIDF